MTGGRCRNNVRESPVDYLEAVHGDRLPRRANRRAAVDRRGSADRRAP